MARKRNQWQSRIIGEGCEAPDQLLANPANWRIHPKYQQDALSAVLDNVGWVQRVIVNKQTGHIVDGHLRVSLAISRNEAEVPVVYVDLTEDEELTVLATIDPLSAMAATDSAKLAELLASVQTDDAALDAVLRGVGETAGLDMGGAVPDAPDVDVDRAEELRAKWGVETGDLWRVPSKHGGEHRILCGDSTNAADVARVMGGANIDAVITDPPYGIDATKMTLGTGKKQFHRGEWDNARPDVKGLVSLADAVIIWGGNYFTDTLPVTNDWLCWHKKNDGLTFSEFELAWSNIGTNCRILQQHWSGEVKAHPTQKPLPVMQWCVGLVEAVNIFDPFLGSGTTAVACEQLARRCFGIEIAPQYIAVTLERLSLMGLTPEREAADA